MITLYQNCILRDNYQEVIRPELLEDYLATLSSVNLNLSADSYFKDSGYFVAYPLPSVTEGEYIYQQLNYGKLTRDDTFSPVYFFVTSIDTINKAIRINYKIDVWSTFYSSVEWTAPSVLSRCSYLAPNSSSVSYITQTSDCERQGYGSPVWTSTVSLTGYYKIVARIQLYTLSSAGDYSERRQLLGYSTISYTKASTIRQIENLLLGQGLGKISPIDTTGWMGSCYYEVMDLWVIDSYWTAYLSDYLEETATFDLSSIDSSLTDMAFSTTGLLSYNAGMSVYTETLNLSHGSTTIAWGVPSTKIDVEPIGYSIEIPIYFNVSPFDFEIYTLINGETIYFTECFHVDLPWQNASADEIQTTRTQKTLQAISGILSIGQGATQIVTGAVTAATGAGAVAGIGEMSSGLSTMASGIMNTASIAASTFSAGSSNPQTSSMVFYYADLFPAICTKSINNLISYLFYNTSYGFVTKTCVENLETILDNWSVYNANYKFCYVKFETVNIAKGAPNDYLNEISSILLNGTKIYTEIPS